MRLTEQIIIPTEYFNEIDNISFLSKNLFNASLYEIRQHFFQTEKFIGYCNLDKLMKNNPDYVALPRKISQQVLQQVCKSFISFFRALGSYKKNPEKFLGRPGICHYLEKKEGRNLLIYTDQAFSRVKIKENIISPSGTNLEIKIRDHIKKINQVRIVPKQTESIYIMEVIYEIEPDNLDLDKNRKIGIDLGVNNLLAITSDKQGMTPILVNGRPIKSINQWFNKTRSFYQTLGMTDCKKLRKLSRKRRLKIRHYFHNVSRRLIDYCIHNNIGTIIIGKNDFWKQEVNLKSRTNQNFVSIPFNNLIEMIKYKAELVGIDVIETEESYTSKTSFIDLESMEYHENYNGYRKNRGMFKSTKSQREINADINGSYNIIRKVFPETFGEGIEGFVVIPKVWKFSHF